ncbi:hypothetical protein OQA88_8296 [Cercophora sp. LCS_1]
MTSNISPDALKLLQALPNLATLQSTLLDAAKSQDLSPETLAKIFKDIGASPEKLRSILNLWLVPQFRPSFVPAPNYTVSGLQDVDFLSSTEPPPIQLPYRMFDIGTGNLVNWPAIGARGQYCMLSHRWKGSELLLGDVYRARSLDLERTKEAIRKGESGGGSGRKDDVQLVLEQCVIDIEAQEGAVKDLYPGERFCLGELLDKRLRTKQIENALEWARNTADKTRAEVRFGEMEREVFEELIGKAGKEVDAASPSGGGNQVSGVVEELRKKLEGAEAELGRATKAFQDAQEDVDFFHSHNRLRDALDDMVSRLEKWKSAIKLQKVIQEADRIFRTKLFQRRDKCYLWTDTVCIDKTNAGELSESLSLMGDWYENAEFCLVQLDTKTSYFDAAVDWRLFEQERGREPTPLAPEFVRVGQSAITGFEDILASKPEWSTRAWTLQELVMSKTTFYLNSEWMPLGRPIESLGYLYHLIPFIKLYTERDTSNPHFSSQSLDEKSLSQLLSAHEKSLPIELRGVREATEKTHTTPLGKGALNASISEKARDEAARVNTAQQIIMLLDALGVKLPKDTALETAASDMARAVYLAAADIAAGGLGSGKPNLLDRLRERLNGLPVSDQSKPRKELETDALHAINFLLKCLVDETLPLILEDREYVASFGNIDQFSQWQTGKLRTGFAAQTVLAAAGRRDATKATDRAYALMGILGVRFPTFHAEGYPMALARLLDQVLITHNDVSVFNWTGMAMGSTIRGRSLYPSSQVAFGSQDDRGRQYNLLLSSQVQNKMDDVMKTYHEVVDILRQAIDTVKDKRQRDLPYGWIERVIKLVSDSGFLELKVELKSVRKVVGYILQHCVKAVPSDDEKVVEEKEKATPTTSKTLSFPSLPSPSLSLPSPSLSLPSPSLSLPTFGMGGKKTDDDAKKGSKFSPFGKKSSFGFGKTAEPVPEVKPPAPAPAPMTAPAPTPPPATPSQPSWVSLNDAVTSHLDYITLPPSERTTPAPHLPSELDSITLGTSSVTKSRATAHHDPSLDPESTICPNPIIVNNSGIEGLFDIQRVIVTFIDHDRLKARIAKAVTPKDRISGWCSVSTGFARVVVSFSCEKRLLEQEVAAVEGVESRVLGEQYVDKGERRGAKLLSDVVVSQLSPGAGKEKEKEDAEVEDKVGEELDKVTDEERLVSRMIEFIQEEKLHLVAGEWVLVRFSGVPGAKWFLCHLELGSAPGQYYGHRIAAGEIDFANATPEPGLVKAWQTYMERKKRKMCYVLKGYLKSRQSAKEGEEKLAFGMKTVGEATKRIDSLGFGLGASSAAAQTNEKEDDEATLLSKDDSDDEEVSAFDRLLDQGRVAARAFGDYTVLAAVEKFFELRADHLDQRLNSTVLKRTPKRLQTAVESINDGRMDGFLPSMFHSATRVHMF